VQQKKCFQDQEKWTWAKKNSLKGFVEFWCNSTIDVEIMSICGSWND
jgi:hypothetical protein